MHTPEEVTLKALEQAKSVNADCYVSLLPLPGIRLARMNAAIAAPRTPPASRDNPS